MGLLLDVLGLSGLVPPTALAGAGAGPAGAPPLGTPPSAAPPVDKNLVAYQAAKAAVEALVAGLKADPQAAHVATQIAAATAKVAAGDGHAAAAQWKDATARLLEAKTIVAAARKLAQDWAGYAARRAVTNALVYSLKGPDNAAAFQKQQAALTAADALAAAAPPKFAAALAALKALENQTRPDVSFWVDTVKDRLKVCESANAKVREFLKDDIAAGKPLVDQCQAAYKAGEFAQTVQLGRAALRILGPAHRFVDRRGTYETQRTAAVAAIAKVRGQASTAERAAALDAKVAEADALATRQAMRLEEGQALLAVTAGRAASLLKLGATIAAARSERTAVDAGLAALDAHAAAARIASERAAIAKLRGDAQAASDAADAAADDPTAGWTQALALLKQARGDAAQAKTLADGFGPAAGAEAAAAATPPDAKAMKDALARLRADGKLVAKSAQAKAADAELKRFEQRATDADKALAAGDTATAAPAMTDAAAALVAARTIVTEHAQFATTLVAVEAGLKALKASKRAAKIQARIDDVATPLAEAKARDQAHDGPAAIAALRLASTAEAAARKADHDRETFDAAAAALRKRNATTKDAGEKKALEDAVVAAAALADGFDFAGAAKALDGVEVGLDKLKLQAMTAGKGAPDAAGIAKLANRMVEKGGATEVDAMIQAVPDGGDPRLVNAMAKGRYGVAFSTGKKLDANTDEAKAMKSVCAMFAQIPQDVRGNPSIKGVGHEDAIPNTVTGATGVGGGFGFDDATITMNGRPNTSTQKFGSNQKAKDPKTGALVDQLPPAADIDPKCVPADTTPVDFLSFAAAHEVGHSVDDKNSFMKQHMSDPAFGGWVVFGASVGPLADIVAKHFGLDAVAEHRRYVLDMLQSKPPARPAVAPLSAEDNALKAFETWHGIATTSNVYRRQGDCDAIKIDGYVYHEAYTRNWVGYLLSARNKGLTGYQFRAPGEWFAELYAGYRSNKLGPDHPARDWLSKL